MALAGEERTQAKRSAKVQTKAEIHGRAEKQAMTKIIFEPIQDTLIRLRGITKTAFPDDVYRVALLRGGLIKVGCFIEMKIKGRHPVTRHRLLVRFW